MRAIVIMLCTAALGAAAVQAAAGELLFYSSVPRNLTEPINKAFEARHPGAKVTMFQAGTETLIEKIQLEIQGKGKPDADVIWAQELPAMQRYAKKGLLMKYVPVDADKIAPAYRDKGGFFHGTFITHAVLMYNSNALNDATAPKSWQDLTASRFDNKLTFANPRISGTGAAVASAMVQNFGWQYWEKVAKNRPMIAAGHPAMVSTIIAGERTVGPMLDYSIVAAVEKKQPIRFVFPKEGAIAVAAYVAIVNGTKSPEDARKFVDFFVSKDAAAILQKNGMYHARTDAEPPKGWPAIAEIKTLPLDWDRHGKELDSTKKKFAELTEK
jgi:iron(III) transport system substrate-binding protein